MAFFGKSPFFDPFLDPQNDPKRTPKTSKLTTSSTFFPHQRVECTSWLRSYTKLLCNQHIKVWKIDPKKRVIFMVPGNRGLTVLQVSYSTWIQHAKTCLEFFLILVVALTIPKNRCNWPLGVFHTHGLVPGTQGRPRRPCSSAILLILLFFIGLTWFIIMFLKFKWLSVDNFVGLLICVN